ncbi:MAG: hypothetical protein ACK4OM_01075 [Alphaproteobacteria bacterium]
MKIFLKNEYCLILFLLIQIVFWWNTKSIKPEMGIVPELPGEIAIKANSLGDEELYFRLLTLEIQNAGDTFGRFTALKNYDYNKLSKWFFLLDTLDDKSNFLPAIASYYYSQTQNTPDVRYIVDYLDYHASKDMANKWWWMSQAVYLANHKLKDTDLALKLAYKLAKSPGKLPMWAREMPAFIHEKRGEKEEAFFIIKDIIDNHEDLSLEELNFMHYFIKERIEKMNDTK